MGMPKSDPIGYDVGHGLWRSLVARCTGGAKVAGSNPVSPTIFQSKPIVVFGGGLFAWNLCLESLPGIEGAFLTLADSVQTVSRRCKQGVLLVA